jgi:hypothetical protein
MKKKSIKSQTKVHYRPEGRRGAGGEFVLDYDSGGGGGGGGRTVPLRMIRSIEHSPLANPELIDAVRGFERELKEKESQQGSSETSQVVNPFVLLEE